MRNIAALAVVAAAMLTSAHQSNPATTSGVQVVADEAQRRVDITIDGQPFTTYMWPTTLKKPVLYPLITDEGITVTRGYPLQPRPNERVDHPHHAGMWFNYGNVNGFDFWNNSDAIKPENRSKMGTILETKIVSTKSGADRGELVVDSVWVTGKGDQLLDQTTHYIFSRRLHERVIDQIITLKALDRAVFNDDKEGVLGIRVAHWLESPDEKGGVFLDASGRPTKVAAADTTDATGVYLTSEGVKGGAVWSTTGPLVLAHRTHGRPYRHRRHSRSPPEPWLPNLLARAWLRTLRRQSAGPQYLRSQTAPLQLHPGERTDRDLPLSCAAPLPRGNARVSEPRSRPVRHRIPLKAPRLPSRARGIREIFRRPFYRKYRNNRMESG